MRQPMLKMACIMLSTGVIMGSAGAQLPQAAPAAQPTGVGRVITAFGVARFASLENWRPGGLAIARTQALFSPPAIRFRDGRAILSNRAVARSTHAEFGTSSRLLTLDATRTRRSPAEAGPVAGNRRDRSVIWSADVGYEMRTGDGSRLRLVATAGVEKRKPLIAIADGHWTGTSARAIGLGWRQADGIALNAGWFGVSSLRPLSALERRVSLAAGSAIAEHGYQAEVSLPLATLEGRTIRLGLRFATASLADQDRLALGATAARDARTTLSLAIPFG